jgi:hypothetical protein
MEKEQGYKEEENEEKEEDKNTVKNEWSETDSLVTAVSQRR